MNNKYLKVGVVTFPIHASGIMPLSNLVSILKTLSFDIYLVTGNAGYSYFKKDKKIHCYGVEHKEGKEAFSRIFKYIFTQIAICSILLKLSRVVDFFIFFQGGQDLIIPMLASRLSRKKVVLLFEGSSVEVRKARKDVFFKPLRLIVIINCILSNAIILYSERLVKEYKLERHRKKILVAARHFLDFNKFKVEKELSQRDEIVGYIGRLCEERGVLEFVRAIPKVLEKRKKVRFLIGGDGHLYNSIERYINIKQLNRKIEILGWIPHEKLPNYLNELKLLVLPSYTEGLPNIMLEAMACGTPVLAANVGSIPDIISDGYTGFLLKENSPQNVATSIIRALEHPNLQRVADNAKNLVEINFTYEAAVERVKKVLHLLLWRWGLCRSE
jgi:glycosyltransferase involved in cell wall biosynthesis